MTDYLFIQLADDQAQATWAAFDAAGQLLSPVERGPTTGARAAADGKRIVLIVPATDVISTQATLPASTQARMRQILPFSLEETFAQDVEELLFAVGPRLASGSVSAAIVANQKLDSWLEALSNAGMTPHAVYSEADGVPETPNTLTLMLQGKRIYGRRPGQPPFLIEGFGIDQALGFIRGAEEDAADLRRLLVFIDDSDGGAQQAEVAEPHDRVVSAEVKLLPDGLFPHLASTLVRRPGTNLLQGPYAPKSNWVALARPWRLAASLLVALGVVTLLSHAVEFFSLRSEDGALTGIIATSCERVVASSRTSVCEAEVQRRLRGAGTGASGETFLSTLSAVAQSRDPASRIEALSYRNRAMDLQLLAANVAALDQFRANLGQSQRFLATIDSTNPNDSGVQGRMKVVGVGQ